MFPPGSGKSFKGTLNNPLAADVNPRARSHLSVHRQSHPLEPIELGVVVPLPDEIGVGDQDARCFIVGPEFADRLSRLNEKSFVVFELAQRSNKCIESFPASDGATRSTVNNQLIGIFCDVRIEIVHQHPHGGFLMPPFACALTAARRVDDPLSTHELSVFEPKSPSRIASATRAISPESARSCVSGGANFRTAANARSTPRPAFNGRRYSRPSAAASSSIASKFSARSTIDRSFSALVIPMDT